jgi:multidrug efflux pump
MPARPAGSVGSSAGSTDYSSTVGDKYEGIVGRSFGKPVRYLVVYGTIVAAMVFFFLHLPTSFLPDEDQGFLLCQVQLPAGATQERTIKTMKQMERHFLEKESKTVEGIITVAGFSFAGRGQNMGLAWVKLKDWKVRKTPDLKAPAIAGRAMEAFSHGSAMAWHSPFRRRPCSNWVWRTVSTSSCRTAAAWGMRS